MKKTILTDGGTTGHATLNLALLPPSKEAGYEIHYIGSYWDMERKLVETVGIPYDDISSGELHRYSDIKNFSGPFRVVKGYVEAKWLLKCHKSGVIFSKGDFVVVPVVLVVKHYKTPVIIHESDITSGLANKTCISSALKICCDFPEILEYSPSDKAALTGFPIRAELLQGDRLSGLSCAHLSVGRPVLLVIGGSLDSVAMNTAVRNILPRLLSSHQVTHVCGKSNLDESLIGTIGHVQHEYVDVPLKHLSVAADLVISRVGANSICEPLALREPNLFVPLSAVANCRDWIPNANSFVK